MGAHGRAPSFFWYDTDKDLKVCFLVTLVIMRIKHLNPDNPSFGMTTKDAFCGMQLSGPGIDLPFCPVFIVPGILPFDFLDMSLSVPSIITVTILITSANIMGHHGCRKIMLHQGLLWSGTIIVGDIKC